MATNKTNVREELLTATGIKPKKTESESDLAARVGAFINEKMSEEAYGELSAAAQKWYEKLCAVEEGGDAPAMPDGSAAPAAKKAAAKKAAPAKKAAAKKTAPAAKKAAAKKGAPAKKAAKAAAQQGQDRQPRASGFRAAVALMAEEPDLTLEEVQKKLQKKKIDYSEASLRAVHSTLRTVVDVFRENGWAAR